MKLLRQLLIISSICLAGELLNKWLGIPLPGNVLGMIILLVCLLAGVVTLKMIKEISDFLLDHLAFFFLPAGVGLLGCMNVIGENWGGLLIITVVSTIAVMLVTGYTVQFFKNINNKQNKVLAEFENKGRSK